MKKNHNKIVFYNSLVIFQTPESDGMVFSCLSSDYMRGINYLINTVLSGQVKKYGNPDLYVLESIDLYTDKKYFEFESKS